MYAKAVFVSCCPNFQTANISAVYPERHNLTAKVRIFVDLLAERIREANTRAPFQLSDRDIRRPNGGI